MSQLTEYYEYVEKTFKDQFKISQNKLYFIPKSVLDKPTCNKISSSFSTSVKELGFLGRGSFGSVSICHINGIPGYCAMKTLVISSTDIDDIKGEIEVLDLASKCQFLPKMLYAGFRPFAYLIEYYSIVVEYISGGTLHDHTVNSNIELDAMKVIFYQIAKALDFLHQHHRTHGDLKPDNIGLTAKGNVKLLDFGKSRNILKPCILPIGTKAYTAPEIFQEIKADGSIDWWSYGIIVTEMLQNKRPFHNKNKDVLKSMVINDKPKFKIVDPNAKDFVTKLLQKNPANRLVKSPWKHKFFNKVNKNIPLFIPGEIELELDDKKAKKYELDMKFHMHPDAKDWLREDFLLRYPTKECVEFMKKK